MPRLEATDPRPEILLDGEGAVLAVVFAGEDALVTVHDRANVWREGPVAVCVWDRTTGSLRWERSFRRRSYETKENVTLPLAVSKDGTLVASAEVRETLNGMFGGLESRVLVWSLAEGELVRSLEVERAVTALAFRSDDTALVVAATDRVPFSWGQDTVDVTEWSFVLEEEAAVRSLATIEACGSGPRLAADGGAVAVTRLHGERLLEVAVIDLARGGSTVVRSEHMAFFETNVAISPGRARVAACNSGGSWPNTVETWSLPEGTPQVHVVRGGNRPTSLAFSPDGGLVAAGTLYPGGVWLLDAGTGEELVRLGDLSNEEPHDVRLVRDTGTYSLAFAPDGRTLAAGTSEGSVVLWDVGTLRDPD